MLSDDTSVTGSPLGESRWQQYTDLLSKKGIAPKARDWYVKRVKEFLRGHCGLGLHEVSGEQVVAYYRRLSKESSLAPWQFKLGVDALRIFFVDLAKAPAAAEVDWDYWLEAGASIGKEHATVATGSAPDQLVSLRRLGASISGGSCTRHPLISALAPSRATAPLS